MLGILHTSPDLVANQETVIVSSDKDMRTLPGLLYNPDKIELLKPEVITDRDAIKFLAMQAMMGDTADGYKGCPSVGVKKAEALVEPHMDAAMTSEDPFSYLFDIVLAPTFNANGCDSKYALVQCQLARIARREDIKVESDGEWTFTPWAPLSMRKHKRSSVSGKRMRRSKS